LLIETIIERGRQRDREGHEALPVFLALARKRGFIRRELYVAIS